MKTININGIDYNIKYTIRALFIFEQITGKPFKVETLLDNYIFFYSMILANNKENILDWDDFINALDNDPNLFQNMDELLSKESKQNALFNDSNTDEEEGKKK